MDLRLFGLLLGGDRVPVKPRGQSGFTTMLFNGELRVMFDGIEAAARDKAFGRFMQEVAAPLDLGDDAPAT